MTGDSTDLDSTDPIVKQVVYFTNYSTRSGKGESKDCIATYRHVDVNGMPSYMQISKGSDECIVIHEPLNVEVDESEDKGRQKPQESWNISITDADTFDGTDVDAGDSAMGCDNNMGSAAIVETLKKTAKALGGASIAIHELGGVSVGGNSGELLTGDGGYVHHVGVGSKSDVRMPSVDAIRNDTDLSNNVPLGKQLKGDHTIGSKTGLADMSVFGVQVSVLSMGAGSDKIPNPGSLKGDQGL